MNNEQLLKRIGSIDDTLIEDAQNVSNFQRPAHKRVIRRTLLVAAVIVLMIGSFSAGALAMRNNTPFDWTEDEISNIEEMGLTADEVFKLIEVNLSEALIPVSVEGSEAVKTEIVLTEAGNEYKLIEIHIPSAIAEGLLVGEMLYFVVEEGELKKISLTD